jgi:hypothetical protein
MVQFRCPTKDIHSVIAYRQSGLLPCSGRSLPRRLHILGSASITSRCAGAKSYLCHSVSSAVSWLLSLPCTNHISRGWDLVHIVLSQQTTECWARLGSWWQRQKIRRRFMSSRGHRRGRSGPWWFNSRQSALEKRGWSCVSS